jgi:hypothetical protein
MIATYLNIPSGVARVLCKLPRRGGLDKLAAQARGKEDAFAIYIGTGISKAVDRIGMAFEIDADFLQHTFRIVLDQSE